MPHTLFSLVLQLSWHLAKISERLRPVSCAYIIKYFKIILHTQTQTHTDSQHATETHKGRLSCCTEQHGSVEESTKQGWQNFLRTSAQTVHKFRRNSFACPWEF